MTPEQQRQIDLLIQGQAQLVDRIGQLADAIQMLALALAPQEGEVAEEVQGNPHAGLDG